MQPGGAAAVIALVLRHRKPRAMQLEVRPPPSRAPASMQTFKHLQRPERSWTCLRIEPLDSKLGLDRSLPVAQRQVIGSPNEGRTKAARRQCYGSAISRPVALGRDRQRPLVDAGMVVTILWLG